MNIRESPFCSRINEALQPTQKLERSVAFARLRQPRHRPHHLKPIFFIDVIDDRLGNKLRRTEPEHLAKDGIHPPDRTGLGDKNGSDRGTLKGSAEEFFPLTKSGCESLLLTEVHRHFLNMATKLIGPLLRNTQILRQHEA
jgi:hypothetical protein